MEFFQQAIKEKLEDIETERIQWNKQKDIHLEAANNLVEFQKSFQIDCLVPIGTKALMPGKLYHTNEIMIGHKTGLFSKCSSHQALEVCKHRLKAAEDRISALDTEWNMYNDRLTLPFTEDVFAGAEDGQREIIEVSTEEEEMRWREEHKKRVAEQKKREAAERATSNTNDDTDYMALLDRALVEEELEDELANMNTDDGEAMRTYLENMIATPNEPIANGSDDDAQSDTSDSQAESKEFQALEETATNLPLADKLAFYKQKLREANDFLAQKKARTSDDLNEILDKSALCDCLQSAIHRLEDTVPVPSQNDVAYHEQSMSQENGHTAEHEQLDQQTRGHLDRKSFARFELEYANRSKGEQLVFYKGQLRSTLKLIASSSLNITQEESVERRLLYEYLSNRIDQLRADILKEKQAQMEERFVDDNSENENGRETDDDDENGNGNGMASENGTDRVSDDNDCDEVRCNGKRRISFANQPMITTYNQEDEPWCIHTNNDENMKSIIDKTFQFFNDDEETSSTNNDSDCVGDHSQNSIDPMPNAVPTNESTNSCIVTECAPVADDDNTLFINFDHSSQTERPIDRQSNPNIVQTPADIYRVFANGGEQFYAMQSPTKTDLLKNFVMNVANLDVTDVTQRMKQMYASKQAGQQKEADICDRINNVQDCQLSGIKPIKSILKNKEAVSMEIHCARTSTMDEDDEISERIDTNDIEERNNFISFETIVGEIVENRCIDGKTNSANSSLSSLPVNDKSDGASNQITSSVRDRPVSLFKRSRQQ